MYKTVGRCREVEPDVIMIEELPINKWTNDYKADFLDINLSLKGGILKISSMTVMNIRSKLRCILSKVRSTLLKGLVLELTVGSILNMT